VNRLAYVAFNHDEPRTVEGLIAEYLNSFVVQHPYRNARSVAYYSGYKQAALDAQAEITRLNAELKLAYKKIQELYDEQTETANC
jgi:hypothetical protein